MTTVRPLDLLYDYVASNAALDAEGDALVFREARWSHAAVQAEVDAMARGLLARGIAKGDRVAALLPPSPAYWFSFLAATSIGAIWVGLNPRYQLSELQDVLEDAAPVLLIAADPGDGRDFAQLLSSLCNPSCVHPVVVDGCDGGEGMAALTDFLAAGVGIDASSLVAARGAVEPRDPITIVYTSGSTGRPKGALLHQQGMIDFAVRQNELWPVSAFRVLNYFPVNHIGCIVDVSVPTLVAGGTMVLMDQFAPRASMELIERERITIWGSVPSVFIMQLALADFEHFNLTSVELIVWGGAAMERATIERLRAVLPRLATNYGMTETSSAITSLAPTDDLEALECSVGPALAGVEVKLVNTDGIEVERGLVGEVHARSRLNFLGYWRQPDATAAAFDADGYFRTGDLAVQRPDGAYRVVGRVKEMYKSGGYNVYPREVEAALEAHPAILACAVVGVADALWQESGVAFVVSSDAVTGAELEAHCRLLLANYKIPKRFLFLDALPLLPIGKVDKAALMIRASAI